MLAVNECYGKMANVRWIISLTVQYNVRHLVLSFWWYPDPCITARSLDPALAPYALVYKRLAEPCKILRCKKYWNL